MTRLGNVSDKAVLINSRTGRRRSLFRSHNQKREYRTVLRRSPTLGSNLSTTHLRWEPRTLRAPVPYSSSRTWRILTQSCSVPRISKTSTSVLMKTSMSMEEPRLTKPTTSYRAFSCRSLVPANPVLNWWLKRSEAVHLQPFWKSGLATTSMAEREKRGPIRPALSRLSYI